MFSKAEAEFLASERVARIATINLGDNTSHLVPVCFVYDGKVFFTSLHARSKRVKNVAARSNVAFLIDRYEEQNGEWKILQGLLIYGRVELLSFLKDRSGFMYAWKLLIQKYPQYKQWSNEDLTPKDANVRRIMKIKPRRVLRWGFGETN